MNNKAPRLRRIPFNLPRILFLTAIWYPTPAVAQAPTPKEAGSAVCVNRPNRLAEKWILRQVEAGGYADLSERFLLESDRVISAAFLQNLLTGAFSSLKVHRHGVKIAHAVVCEPVDLNNAEVLFDTSLNDSYFESDLSLTQSHFKRSLMVENTIFNGSVDGKYAEIDVGLDAESAEFKQEVNFNSIKVGHSVFFDGALFNGRVDFVLADIGSSFYADGSIFTGSERALFNSMKVKGHASFHGAVFDSPMDFSHTEIGRDFDAGEAQFKNERESTSFSYLRVSGIWLDNATFAHPFYLDGLTYDRITPESSDDLIALMKQSDFNVGVYTKLEAFYLEQGYLDRANEVYIAQRRRERSERLHGFLWVGSVLLDALVGYGRRPWLALSWSSLFIVLGWLVFRDRRYMTPQKREHYSRTYHALWYSIDLFLPVIQLQEAIIWMPDPEYRFAWYANVHRILGWILIPIGLAAVTGLIK